MSGGKSPILGKISIINYGIATHEGNAVTRLASQSDQIVVIPEIEVPAEYRERFKNLKGLIEDSMSRFPNLPVRGKLRIQNRTAVKYIILLMSIEDYLENRSD